MPPNLILCDSIGHAEYLMTANCRSNKVWEQPRPGHDLHANSFLALYMNLNLLVFYLCVRQWNACDEMWFAFYDMHLAR